MITLDNFYQVININPSKKVSDCTKFTLNKSIFIPNNTASIVIAYNNPNTNNVLTFLHTDYITTNGFLMYNNRLDDIHIEVNYGIIIAPHILYPFDAYLNNTLGYRNQEYLGNFLADEGYKMNQQQIDLIIRLINRIC